MPIKRSYFKELYRQINEPEISVLIGARQVGKSTLMRALQKKAEEEGRKTHFYNLELSSDLEELSGKPGQVIETLRTKARVVFIDEFHYLPNAFKIFKAIYDSKVAVKIYASGSSSIEMHKHLKESLAGRFRKTIIYPLSFPECAALPEMSLREYNIWGGLPGLTHLHSDTAKAELLENIVSSYVMKDIKALIREENIRAFNSLLYLLAQNQGQVTVVANLARETCLNQATLARHLEIMAQTFVCFPLPSYATNLANELKKSRKHYFFDPGIRNHLLKDYRPFTERDDSGSVMESFVFLHLKRQLKQNMELRFWRTKRGEEVDFVAIKNRIPLPVEVKSRLTASQVPAGLISFMKKYPKAPYGIVYNLAIEDEAEIHGRKVYFKKIEDCVAFDFFSRLTD